MAEGSTASTEPLRGHERTLNLAILATLQSVRGGAGFERALNVAESIEILEPIQRTST